MVDIVCGIGSIPTRSAKFWNRVWNTLWFFMLNWMKQFLEPIQQSKLYVELEVPNKWHILEVDRRRGNWVCCDLKWWGIKLNQQDLNLVVLGYLVTWGGRTPKGPLIRCWTHTTRACTFGNPKLQFTTSYESRVLSGSGDDLVGNVAGRIKHGVPTTKFWYLGLRFSCEDDWSEQVHGGEELITPASSGTICWQLRL